MQADDDFGAFGLKILAVRCVTITHIELIRFRSASMMSDLKTFCRLAVITTASSDAPNDERRRPRRRRPGRAMTFRRNYSDLPAVTFASVPSRGLQQDRTIDFIADLNRLPEPDPDANPNPRRRRSENCAEGAPIYENRARLASGCRLTPRARPGAAGERHRHLPDCAVGGDLSRTELRFER